MLGTAHSTVNNYLVTDYWFEIKLTNGKTVKGHFTLKR